MTARSNPRRVEHNLTAQAIGNETLVYDEGRHLAFCLDPVASAVWQQCDGDHSVEQIAANICRKTSHEAAEEIVAVTLARLEQDSLLQVVGVSFAHLGAISRRSLVRKFGVSAALLLPVVAVLATPAAAQGYNGCTDCTFDVKDQLVKRNALQSSSATSATAPASQSLVKP